jgi:hypothetical protein
VALPRKTAATGAVAWPAAAAVAAAPGVALPRKTAATGAAAWAKQSPTITILTKAAAAPITILTKAAAAPQGGGGGGAGAGWAAVLRAAVQGDEAAGAAEPVVRAVRVREPQEEVGSKQWLLAQAHLSTADKYGQVCARSPLTRRGGEALCNHSRRVLVSARLR